MALMSNLSRFNLKRGDERWVEHTEGAVAEVIPKEFTEGKRIIIREIAGTSPRLIICCSDRTGVCT